RTTAFLFALILIAACIDSIKNKIKDHSEKPESTEGKEISIIEKEPIIEPKFITNNLKLIELKDLYGYWVGSFIPDIGDEEFDEYADMDDIEHWDHINKITVSIDSISGDSLIGHSVVAGNRRPFKGTIKLDEKMYKIDVNEPGTDPYDGHFEFSIALDGDKISGTWEAYRNIEIKKRRYALKKRLFKYNPDAELTAGSAFYDWNQVKIKKYKFEDETYKEYAYLTTTSDVNKFNPSKRLLSKKDIENLGKADLYILRNSIYAKHGYTFKKRPVRAYFDNMNWYMPLYTDIKDQLTDIELKNIKLLLSYEEHAKAYYDVFGR
ncbi:MAG TPA: YARHG domain-containing protein, partial [Bacteroidia bacterium]